MRSELRVFQKNFLTYKIQILAIRKRPGSRREQFENPKKNSAAPETSSIASESTGGLPHWSSLRLSGPTKSRRVLRCRITPRLTLVVGIFVSPLSDFGLLWIDLTKCSISFLSD